jgi:NAD-dependent deacetylase
MVDHNGYGGYVNGNLLNMKKLVVLTGAGISAESGLKTFRDSDGLWEGYDIAEVATPGGWRRDPAMVLEFYNMRRRSVLAAQPNTAHTGLAALEEMFEVHIITQNIDDLHERAGSSNVLHLHGEILKMHSEKNPALIREIRDEIMPGDLAEDGGQFRPAVVWFEEAVPMMAPAVRLVNSADVFVVIGTSLAVYPAAGLVNYVRPGIRKFIIDKKLPHIQDQQDLTTIEKPATEGVEDLRRILTAAYSTIR